MFKIDTGKEMLHEALNISQERINQLALLVDNYFASGMNLSTIASRIQSSEKLLNREKLYATFLMGYMYKALIQRKQYEDLVRQQKAKEQATKEPEGSKDGEE